MTREPRSTAPITLDQWQHVAFTFDSATGAYRLYVNGNAVLSTTKATGANTQGATSVGIGAALRSVPSYFFTGGIDEVRFYDQALSQSEVAQVRDGGSPGAVPEPAAGALLALGAAALARAARRRVVSCAPPCRAACAPSSSS